MGSGRGVKNVNNNLKRMAEPGVRLYFFFLVAFAAATLFFREYDLAIVEGSIIIFLVIYSLIMRKRREKQLAAYIEAITYDTENAKNNTLMNFPMPIAVFRLNDSRIVWGNDSFFAMSGSKGARLDASVSDVVPGFSGKWLLEGKSRYPTLLTVKGRKYQLHGNMIRSENSEDADAYMGITYWVDVTEYDNIRLDFENSRPVAAVVVIDNLDELVKNQPERIKNDIRDAIEDKLNQWADERHAIIRRYERDRYLIVFEHHFLKSLVDEKFPIIQQVHQVVSPTGINASLSIGLGTDAGSFAEALQFASVGAELALSRGGDQAVVKNRLSFEFYGGRGVEVEKRTKVRSRVMANTLKELIKDSSRVLVMGHQFADLDSVGGAVGVCCLARKLGVRANIVIDLNKNAAGPMLEMLHSQSEYKEIFCSPAEAMFRADGHTLLVVVDTNRPEQVQSPEMLESCNRVAVIDHHRRGTSYIEKMTLNYHEPYASSASELVTELLQYLVEPSEMLRAEAEALLSGIVLDTKNFTNRTGGRTFEAAAFLRRRGADTQEVQRMFQSDLQSMISRYDIIRQAELYHEDIAIVALEEECDRVTAAKAADELLTLKGVQASFVLYKKESGVYISARSLGDVNVQVIVEALGGGGNSTTAGGQLPDTTVQVVYEKLIEKIDQYFEN